MTKDELKAYLRLTGTASPHPEPIIASSSWMSDKYQIIFHEFVDNGTVAIYKLKHRERLVELPFNEVPEFLNDNIQPLPTSTNHN